MVDIMLFAAAYAWPAVIILYVYIHFFHAELVSYTKRLDRWQCRANPVLWEPVCLLHFNGRPLWLKT